MKRASFLALFISVHIVFIVLQIYKHSCYAQFVYDKQKHESLKTNLLAKRQDLTGKLYACKDRSMVKEFAIKQLNMEQVKLSQIKKLPSIGVQHAKQNI